VIKKNKSFFRVNSSQKKFRSFSIEIDMPGRHYILNTLGAIAIAISLNIKPQVISKALKKFKGVSRRFDLYEQFRLGKKIINLIDDYGHHPTEIKAVLDSIKKGFPGKKINLVFQPHRYSRTKDLFEQFSQILATVDRLFLFEIYSAGEQEIEGISSYELIKNIKNENYVLDDMVNAKLFIEDKIKDSEILLVMGAGSVGNWVRSQLLGDIDG
jgi:UDP-N-acetylmuramate--alanine ligase